MCFTIKNEEATSRKHPRLSFKKGHSEKEGLDRARDDGEDVDDPEFDLVTNCCNETEGSIRGFLSEKGRSETEGSDRARDDGEDVDDPECDLVTNSCDETEGSIRGFLSEKGRSETECSDRARDDG